MNTRKVFGYGLLAVIFALAFAACAEPDPGTGSGTGAGNPSAITYTVTQTDGENNTADSTGIVFTFSASVDSLNLTAADITVGGMVKGNATLSGSGSTRTLSPITVNSAGLATVFIDNTGIEARIKQVTVYKAGQKVSAATLGLAYELIDTGDRADTYRVRKGTVTSGAVIIPDSYSGKAVTEIGGDAFKGTNITSVTIPASVTYMYWDAFESCRSLATVTFAQSSELKNIGGHAFANCTSLTSITIPASVESIGYWAFLGCRGLTNITVEAGNKNFSSESGILYDKNKTKLVSYPSAKGNITIPTSVTVIAYTVFEGCTTITGITIHDGVTSIGGHAFGGCTNLRSITIPASVTEIEGYAFNGWNASQIIYIEGHTSQTSADNAWNSNGNNWRNGSNATIVYKNSGGTIFDPTGTWEVIVDGQTFTNTLINGTWTANVQNMSGTYTRNGNALTMKDAQGNYFGTAILTSDTSMTGTNDLGTFTAVKKSTDALDGTIWRGNTTQQGQNFDLVYTFNSPNFTCTVTQGTQTFMTLSGTYSISGNTVTVSWMENGQPQTVNYTLSGNTMTMVFEGMSLTLTKDTLHGTTWKGGIANFYGSDIAITLTFNSPNYTATVNDGTQTFVAQTGTYSISGNTVTAAYLEYGQPKTSSMPLSGNTMTSTFEGMSVTLTKQ